MKVLVVAPTPFFSDRGCHLRIRDQVLSLQIRGHNVLVVTYHLGRDLPGISVVRTPLVPWYKKIETTASLHKVYLDFLLLIRSLFAYFSFRPDVVHCHLHEGAIVGIFLRYLFGARVVFDSQGSLALELEEMGVVVQNSMPFRALSFIEGLIYRLVPVVLVSSLANKTHLVSRFSVPESKIVYVPDGIDFANTSIPGVTFREDARPLRFIYIGGLSRSHGIDALIDIAVEMLRVRRDFLFIIGGYPNVLQYQEMVKARGVAEFFSFAGRIPSEEIYAFLSTGDVGVTLKKPTTQANLKIVHYASVGLPVIAYRHDTNVSLIGEYAHYLPADASAKESVSFFLALFDPKLRLLLSSKGARYVRAHFDMRDIVRTIEKAYARDIA